MKKIHKISAVQMALENIRKYISENKLSSLPSEDELSTSLGVSRLTVREAITVLEKEGVVSRVQGKGTMVNSFITKLNNRIDSGSDIEGSLKKQGYDVRFDVVSVEYKMATKSEQAKMEIGNEEILVVEKVLYANESPVAVYIDRIPKSNLKNLNFTKEDFLPAIFPVVERLCECNISHDVVNIKASSCDERLSKIFNIDKNHPLITFEVFEYLSDGKIIMYNTEYYTGEFVDFTICRNVAYKAWD